MTNNIKNLRKAAGISQKELAALCNVRKETISRIEKGLYNPSLQLAYDITCCIEPTKNITNVFTLSQTKNSS